MGCCESIEPDYEWEEQIIPSPNTRPTIITTTPPTTRITTLPTTVTATSIVTPAPPPPIWDVHEFLAEKEDIDTRLAKNIIQLLEDQNTVPFICRYRRDLISSRISPDKLRDIKNSYTGIVGLRKRAEAIISELEQLIDVNAEIRAKILGAKTIKELELLHTTYIPVSKDEQSQNYEVYSYHLLLGNTPQILLQCVVDRRDSNFDTFEKVKDVICRQISNLLSKDTGVCNELLRLKRIHRIVLKCSKANIGNTKEDNSIDTSSDGNRNESKYEQYFNFENDVRYVKPHQVLAINRGERLKFLKVHIEVPEEFKNCTKNYIYTVFMCNGIQYALRSELLERTFEECYTNKLVPIVRQQVRWELTSKGKKAALAGFAMNLRQLLLTPPLKGERILGIDPGFKNGCKLALISETADVLEVGVVYPHVKENDPENCAITLAKMLTKHSCKRIALGNGTACRETEAWLQKLFDKGILDKNHVRYDIVSEQGASVYSCSEMARTEFPKLDVLLISAVSIARRLNDPLSEYVKIEPRHLGVGMYQHDIDTKLLMKSLNEVVSECVSYVGVDINTVSLSLLKHVAGLNEYRAKNIIRYRKKKGPFRTRKDLLRVKGIGKEAYMQCAGFIRIEPMSVGGKVDNMLDCTLVHPESYAIATKIIKQCDLELEDIGKTEFIFTIQSFAQSYPIENLANKFGIPSERLQGVLTALQRQLFQDYRSDRFVEELLFKNNITRFEDLFIGEIVTGKVRNIVDFGAFIDIGLESDALIHKSKMNGIKLKLGDRVTSTVLDINIPRQHVDLRLDKVI